MLLLLLLLLEELCARAHLAALEGQWRRQREW